MPWQPVQHYFVRDAKLTPRAGPELLRTHSQRTGRKLYDIATAVLDSHLLLAPRAASESAEPAG